MADLGLSEFTFEFSFLYEQVSKNWNNLQTFPLLPSLIKENKIGWDAMLPTKGAMYYYQFKQSELFYRGNAKYISDGTYHAPYFRIKLHKADYNKQHRILWKWAKRHPYNNTYYVAPEMVDKSEFRNAFLSHTVVSNSRLIPLTKCVNYSPNDNNQHYITYQQNVLGFYQFSETKKSEGDIFGKDLGKAYEKNRSNFVNIDNEYANDLLNDAISFTQEILEEYDIDRDKEHPSKIESDNVTYKLMHMAKILWITLGVVTVLVGEREEASK